MSITQPLLGGIEAGGTKYVCAVGHADGTVLEEVRFPTGDDPQKTLSIAAEFFKSTEAKLGKPAAIGIGTFGPARIDAKAADFGSILKTPKPGWSNVNVVEGLRKAMGDVAIPIRFETDVNAAALAEARLGIAIGKENVAYITIGTGIGAGYIHRGELLQGRMHPEVGHLFLPNYDLEFGKDSNVCPFHDDCFEGRASGPAIEKRWGKPGHELPDEHPAWRLEARYMAAGSITLTATWSPDIIIIGGGVSQKEGLIEIIREEFSQLAADYWALPPLDEYLVRPALDQQAGIAGAFLLAEQALER